MMTRRMAILMVVLFCTTALTPKAVRESPGGHTAQVAGADAKDLKTDLERMHSLLSQMQKNAAFVSQGDTPLKHEFELEIEMWQILLQDMEKKLNSPDSRSL